MIEYVIFGSVAFICVCVVVGIGLWFLVSRLFRKPAAPASPVVLSAPAPFTPGASPAVNLRAAVVEYNRQRDEERALERATQALDGLTKVAEKLSPSDPGPKS